MIPSTFDSSILIAIPGFIALYICVRRGVAQSFLGVYLPVLLLTSDAFRWTLKGQLSFSESAIVPIGLIYLATSWREWNFGIADLLVAAFAAIMIVAECIDHNFHEARNLAIRVATTVVFPYIMGKGLMRREELWIWFAKTASVSLAIVGLVGLFELATGINPFVELPAPFFPGHPFDVDHVRLGLTRTTGPFGHAILAAIMLLATYRLARWLDWNNLWQTTFVLSRLRAVRLCEGLIALGSVMTLSRGPWIAAGLAGLVVNVARTRRRKRISIVVAVLLLMACIPAFYATMLYVSANPTSDMTELHTSAIYRYLMLKQYVSTVAERPLWGWGRGGFPSVGILISIDNQYLLLALQYGLAAACLLPTIFVWSSTRLWLDALGLPRGSEVASLMFTLVGMQIIFAVALTMSWLGAQTGPFLFLVFGSSEAILQISSTSAGASDYLTRPSSPTATAGSAGPLPPRTPRRNLSR